MSEVGHAAPGDNTTYTLDQASPMVLQQFSVDGTTSATAGSKLVLPQAQSGQNAPISGEFGSASEGLLQLSGNNKYLTIMGYGVHAATFNGSPANFGSSTGQLGQSTSASVPRVVGLIDGNENVNSTTTLTNVFNTNNPRSAYTADGTSFYVSGQGASKTDPFAGACSTPNGAPRLRP